MEGGSFSSCSFTLSSRADSEQGFPQIEQAVLLVVWLQPCSKQKRHSEDFRQLGSAGVSDNHVLNSITEFTCVFAVHISRVVGEYEAVLMCTV